VFVGAMALREPLTRNLDRFHSFHCPGRTPPAGRRVFLWAIYTNERVYLMAYDSVATARANIAQYFDWYNTERPHSSLDRTTPDTVYQELLPKQVAAA
jgi:transposase InsO family protein